MMPDLNRLAGDFIDVIRAHTVATVTATLAQNGLSVAENVALADRIASESEQAVRARRRK